MYNEAVLSRILICSVLLTSPLFADSRTVLVLPFENQTNDRNVDWLGEGVSELILDRLYTGQGVYLFDRDERLAAYERAGIPDSTALSRATAIKIGWELGADSVITGRISGTHENFTVEAR